MDALSTELKRWRLQSPWSNDDDYVLASDAGTALDGRNLSRRGLRRPSTDAGIAGVTFHALRHTFASILIAQGHNAVYVAEQMGHSQPSETLDTYSHLFNRARHAEIHKSKLDAEFGGLFEVVEGGGAESHVP